MKDVKRGEEDAAAAERLVVVTVGALVTGELADPWPLTRDTRQHRIAQI